jgi:histidinol dehydrogenase
MDMRIVKLTNETKNKLMTDLLKRTTDDYGEQELVVKEIIKNIHDNGDTALFEYTKKFDKADINASNVKVTDAEIEEAYGLVDGDLIDVIRKAIKNIKGFHELQKRNSWINTYENGSVLGQRVTPIESAGVYVPGGKAAYPSSVLMNILPAKVAGVEKITMVTPAVKGYVNPLVLAAAYVCGVDHVYKIGGAQAIAALAYGTKTIERVDKIVGPGNIFVALAKREVYGLVGIDSIAGPSEICIIADETCKAKYVAADLLGQAEHDQQASSTLFITNKEKAYEIKEQLIQYYNESPRKEILKESLTNCS